MAVTTITLEAHDLDTRTGLRCQVCDCWTVTEVDVAVVVASSLRLLRTVTGSTCLACGSDG